MDKLLHDALHDLGLNDKEIRFFLVTYHLGAATMSDITKAARLERSTAYVIAQRLMTQGLIMEDHKHYRKLFMAIEPAKLLRMLSAKQRQVGRHELALKEHLPELQALYQASDVRPRVRTYQGKQGLLHILRDILETPQEVLLWTNQATEGNLFTPEAHRQFIAERLRKHIPIRVLAVNNQKAKDLQATDASNLRTTKLLPQGTDFSAEIYIYGNKVAMIDHNKAIIGVILESPQTTQAQRAIFEMNWAVL